MTHSVLTVLVVTLYAGQAPVTADDDDQRLRMLVDSVGVYGITSTGDDETTVEFELHATPLMRFDNQVGGVVDGVVMMWTSGSRPAVVAQVFVLRDGLKLHEFQSMATGPLNLREQDMTRWAPAEAGIRFRAFPDAAAPAAAPARRLLQMKALAQQFAVTEDFRNDPEDKQTQSYQVRLQNSPVHRYRSESEEVVDGAMFAFVHGTDPEAFLLIEAVQIDDSPAWRYAFAPMTCWAMHAVLDDDEVWTCPEQFRTHHERGVYHIWRFGEN